MKSSEKRFSKIAKVVGLIVFAVIALVPFHAFFTTWIGSNTGGLLLVRSWKEVLVLVATVLSIWLLIKDTSLRATIFNRTINKAIVLFSLYLLLVSIILVRDPDALALGLVIQLRLYVVFLLAQIVTYYKQPSRKFLLALILIPSMAVVVFGLLQLFALPVSFLAHFGYQKELTIPPFFTIDNQLNKIRIASTLRGPNPLGVYLIIPISLLCALISRHVRRAIQKGFKKPLAYQTVLAVLFLAASLVVLYGSQSRSAWLGLVASLATMLFLVSRSKIRFLLIGLSVVIVLSTGISVYHWRNTTFVQDIVLHDNPIEGGKVSSNQGHISALTDATNDIKKHPVVGCGAGCAGPASVHNKAGTKLAENYFVQTAQEGGLLGLAFLLVIFGMVFRELLKKLDMLSVVMLGTFVGIGVASLLSHAWADDTIAYLWWGTAGLLVNSYSQLGSATANAKNPHTSVQASSSPST